MVRRIEIDSRHQILLADDSMLGNYRSNRLGKAEGMTTFTHNIILIWACRRGPESATVPTQIQSKPGPTSSSAYTYVKTHTRSIHL
ncbi:hypothetical protein TWF225_010570 [Orbilia oligospora]|nr:hypothetical protein TWF225_010570 [Orbilia oligospora]KAF3250995.1 hypothetical protein TWF128_007416 [Orbilia oligospora]KAF3259076.1 hypothetical protein TWF217_005225 [Orbilia oligospora]